MAPHTPQHAAWPAYADPPPALRNCAAWWLARLERALRERDYGAAAEADREFARLGWTVSARPLSPDRALAQKGRHASR